MKVIVVLIILVSSLVQAGQLESLNKAATANIEEMLFLNDGDHTYRIVSQDIGLAEKGMNFGIETKIEVRSIHSGGEILRLCNTQIIQTSRGFEIFKTVCL